MQPIIPSSCLTGIIYAPLDLLFFKTQIMKKIFTAVFIMTMLAFFNNAGAQTKKEEKTLDTTHTSPVSKNKETAKDRDATDQAAESLEKAAASAQRAAEKLKVVIENKADKMAKTSQPVIENFLSATANLIEKLSLQIEQMVDEGAKNKENTKSGESTQSKPPSK